MINFLCLAVDEFNLATLIVGILSLCGVIANILVTSNNNKNKIYTDLITHRRISTMQEMMDCSSECIKSMYSIFSDDCNLSQNLDNFMSNKSQLFYDTNYKSKPELELRDALNLMGDLLVGYTQNFKNLTKAQKKNIFEVVKVSVDYYQMISCIYCKCEWERAKRTSLNIKEDYNTEENYYIRRKEFEKQLNKQHAFLINNTFENIVKK